MPGPDQRLTSRSFVQQPHSQEEAWTTAVMVEQSRMSVQDNPLASDPREVRKVLGRTQKENVTC